MPSSGLSFKLKVEVNNRCSSPAAMHGIAIKSQESSWANKMSVDHPSVPCNSLGIRRHQEGPAGAHEEGPQVPTAPAWERIVALALRSGSKTRRKSHDRSQQRICTNPIKKSQSKPFKISKDLAYTPPQIIVFQGLR